jgi:hypothetical protein
MSDATAERAPSEDAAALAVARLAEMSPDLRGCAVLDSGGRLLAASGEADRWSGPAAALLEAADAAGSEPATEVHVATEVGEAFAVRHEGLAMVAVAERFVLASLMIFDMRAVLRDLAGELGLAGSEAR